MMNQDQFSLHYHELKFKLHCYESKGDGFQDFFASIMGKHDSSFIPIRAHGNIGDMKCDGYSENTNTVYQCYSPDDIEKKKTLEDARKKIQDDFAGAKQHWHTDKGKWMKCWTFVYGFQGELPAPLVQDLLALKAAEKEFEIDTWGREKLWTMVASLSFVDRITLLGAVPNVGVVADVTAAEIQVLVDYVSRQSAATTQDDDLRLLAVIEKLQKNGLSMSIQELIKSAVSMSPTISDYFARHPDWDFQNKVKNAIVNKYEELAASGLEPDFIVLRLIEFIQGPKFGSDLYYFAAVGLIAHYFQLCSIFEK